MKLFNAVQRPKVAYSKFDLSHENKLSMRMGNLVPILCREVVPGDKFRINTELLMRLSPLASPAMTRLNAFIHYFFVPNRIIWTEWEDFITGGQENILAPIHPHIIFNDANQSYFLPKTLADYLGFPSAPLQAGTQCTFKVSALPFRAYQEIWREYYMDRNLTDDSVYLAWDKLSGEVTGASRTAITTLRKRCWEKDYFTSALPWAQRGTGSTLPIDVVYHGQGSVAGGTLIKKSSNDTVDINQTGFITGGTGLLKGQPSGETEYVDNINSASFTINNLRKYIKIQEWLERSARGGSRYIETILSHFGVRSSDARLQRPEYLGGRKVPIVISEVLQTYKADGDVETNVGEMFGHGVGVGSGGATGKFEEHGILMGILSVLPRTSYQQGLDKMFSRTDKFDYYWPEFAQLGEQEVKNKEIYLNRLSSETEGEGTFGYQSRYAEYKYAPSKVHGDFKTSLAYWHQGRIFTGLPVLNQAFVESDPSKRIFSVTDPSVDELWVQLFHNISAIRPMPYFGTPAL